MLAPRPALAAFESLFAPKADLWPRWATHDPASTATVDHAPWDRFLKRYVTRDPQGLNRIAYGRVTASDRQTLAHYIAGLAATPVSKLNRAQQFVFWVNLYNALTVRLVVEHYPVKSIRDIDISPGLFADGPWGKKLVTIEGGRVGLDDIEHRILRPIWRDPRIHYAVNCASVGCPNLRRDAFTAANAERLLEAGARDYVNSPRGARVTRDGLVVSSIYVWFQADFGGSDRSVIAHLARYADPDLKAKLAKATTIAGHAYDWRLNDAAVPKR
jgi:hypothetical protein